ncbi:hypothetical protein PLESTM_001853700 [Pleodorina starrii]|nr:hypothetical protein PLESTM_001853700 [Pleodorina starrii]
MGIATSLHRAAESQDLAELRLQVQHHPSDINKQESTKGWTPLHVAAVKGFDPGVRELLARGGKPDTPDKEGRTALHLAAEHGHLQVVVDLLKRGANKAVRDGAGRTPYDYAVQRHPSVAALLGGPVAAAAVAAAPPPSLRTASLPSATSTHQLLPPPPQLPSPLISTRAFNGGGAFPQVPHVQTPTEPLLVPPPSPLSSRRAAPYPAGPTAAVGAAAADPYGPRGYGAGAAAAAPPPPPHPYPQPESAAAAEQRRAMSAQPQAPATPLPYPAVPGTQQPAAVEGRRGGDVGTPAGGPYAQVQQPFRPSQPPAPPPPPPPIYQAPPSQPPLAYPAAAQPLQSGPSFSPSPQRPAEAAGAAGHWRSVDAAAAGAGRVEPTRGSSSAAGAATDLDWGPSVATDWGGEPDPPPPPPIPSRPNFNPIMSARIQLEKLLGAGLYHLGVFAGGWTDPGVGAAGGSTDPRVGGGAASGVSVASAGGSSIVSAGSSILPGSRTYGYEELVAATGNFSPANKLGEGGYGPVYRGWLDGIPVAVKVMDTSEDCMQGRSEFEAEVSILSSLHHPHVVLLIGSCPDKGILVYELLPNGSLESHLFGAGGGSGGGGAGSSGAVAALSWGARVRIAAEVASALLFLHTAPTPIVHMDLKPANILLDTHLTAKLGDVGLARLAPTLARPAGHTAAMMRAGTSTVRDSKLVGTFQYMDPEYMQTGQYSARSDVYALGLVLLQMLTGRQGKEVISQVEKQRRGPLGIGPCIDPRAGPWPAAEATAFADLALRCVAYSRQDRPDLRTVILPTLMQLKQRATQLYPHPHHQQQQPTEKDGLPPMYLCPITQDVMVEPVVAADGYTYERLAISEWMLRARTSPMTNLPLEHTNLVDNRTLRSAIAEWQQQQQQQQQQQRQQAQVMGQVQEGVQQQQRIPAQREGQGQGMAPLPARVDSSGGW